MASNNKSQLVDEYVKKIKSIYMPILRLCASHRFDIKDGQIVSKSKYSQFFSIIAVLVVDLFAFFVLLETSINNNYLFMPEYISIIQFTILSNAIVLNINFSNCYAGADLMRNFIEIDAFLGIEETRFIRRISCKDALFWCSFVGCFEVVLITVLVSTFQVFQLPIFTYITGVIYFCLLFCMVYDNVFHVVSYKFLCMRVHYLNVALVKTAKLYKGYLTDQLLAYPFFWKKGYDDFVNSQSCANPKYFTDALEMIFDQKHRITMCYRFLVRMLFIMVFSSTVALVISTFLAVQSVIIYIKDPEVPVIRTMALVGWFLMGWTIFAAITGQTDKFSVQIQRTKLICIYIQLKPNKTDEIYELAKNILDTISVRDHRYSIYNMFYFDGRLMVSLTTSIFVYITMQLQIAFPKRIHQIDNATRSTITY